MNETDKEKLFLIEKLRNQISTKIWYSEPCGVKNCWCNTISTKVDSDSMDDCIIPAGCCNSITCDYISELHNAFPKIMEQIKSLESKPSVNQPEVFEIHITGDSSILANAKILNIKTIEVNLLKPNKEFLRKEYMTSFVFKTVNFELCKEYVLNLAQALTNLGTKIHRVKIECPYFYKHYRDMSLYIESHFEATDSNFPISQNAAKTTFLATDRVYAHSDYDEFQKKYENVELELCLYDTNSCEDLDWFELYGEVKNGNHSG